MGILSNIASKFVKRKNAIVSGEDYELSSSMDSMPQTYQHYVDNQYENGYSSIRAIANSFILVSPFAQDGKGKKVVKANALDKLYFPNKDMSPVDFREALAVMSLVHPKVYLLHWHYEDDKLVAGGKVEEKNIAGYTFVENVIETRMNGITYYSTGMNKFTAQDLLILRSTNPYDLSKGFSPAQAARRWTKLDDYIAEYQSGFFANGAIPAGMFIIRAKSISDYKDIKHNLQEKHRGAGKNNNVTYSYQPLDTNGIAQQAQIEWIPFNVQNKDMALKDLFIQVNQKIDSAYGVPASIRGVNDNNTYASVEVDKQIMAEYTVSPFLLKLWSRMNHELNRVTGGLGYVINYKYDIPALSDAKKIEAETLNIYANIVNTLGSVYEIGSIVSAFNLPTDISKLTEKPPKPVIEDNPNIDMGDEVNDSPEQPVIGDPAILNKGLKVKKLTTVDSKLYEARISNIVKGYMETQVNRAISMTDIEVKSKAFGDSTEQDNTDMAKDILVTLTPLIMTYGDVARQSGIELILEAGLSTDNIKPFTMTEHQKTVYNNYLKRVATTYNEQTAEQIRMILDNGVANEMTANEIKSQLKEVILGDSNQYRVDRIAKTEVNLSEGKASVQAMQNISDETGYKVYKEWTTSGADPCEFCLALSGTRTLIDENFVDLHGEIHGVDGGVYKNDFTATDTADAHPNCNCYITYTVED